MWKETAAKQKWALLCMRFRKGRGVIQSASHNSGERMGAGGIKTICFDKAQSGNKQCKGVHAAPAELFTFSAPMLRERELLLLTPCAYSQRGAHTHVAGAVFPKRYKIDATLLNTLFTHHPIVWGDVKYMVGSLGALIEVRYAAAELQNQKRVASRKWLR